MRKMVYAAGLLLLVIVAIVFGFRHKIFPEPTCMDTKQNGYESGVDCGGECAKKCAHEVRPITVVWSRALSVSPGVYDLVAFISNKNSDSAPLSLNASFTVFDEKGLPLYKNTIPTIPPAATDMPIIIQNVRLSSPPKNMTVTLSEGTSYTISSRFQTSQISTVRTRFENGETPRVYVTVRNASREPFSTIPVRVILYDVTQTATAVGQTVIERLQKEEEQTLVFTWKQPFKEAPLFIRAYPVFDPFGK